MSTDMNTEDTQDYKDTVYSLFELARDFFAALGAITVILATVFYSWGYFS